MSFNQNDKVIVGTLNTSSDDFYSIDGVARDVWNLIGTGLSTEEIIYQLEKQYVVSRDQLMTDVNTFIAELLKLGIICERS